MRSLDGRLYRAALALCPAGFRFDHGDELARDFDEARREAVATGNRALWTFRLLMAIDVARTFGAQWFRTGVPVIGLASVIVALVLAEGAATLARRATFQMPSDPAHAEILGVLLLAITSVVLIAITIALNVWVSWPSRRGRKIGECSRPAR